MCFQLTIYLFIYHIIIYHFECQFLAYHMYHSLYRGGDTRSPGGDWRLRKLSDWPHLSWGLHQASLSPSGKRQLFYISNSWSCFQRIIENLWRLIHYFCKCTCTLQIVGQSSRKSFVLSSASSYTIPPSDVITSTLIT